jgi:probable selenium-dependent hydroxylase accessory protein YqeC
MWVFRNIDLVNSVSTQKYVVFVGSGGKTSLMEYIASELLKRGHRVAITTTTKIFAKNPYRLMEEGLKEGESGPFIRVGSHVEQGKLTALRFEDIKRLGDLYDVVLVEADGARGKPLKFPSDHEPVIPLFSERIFVLCGLDGLFGRVDEKVFRWELFQEASGITGNTRVDRQVFLRLFSDQALLKGVDRRKCTVVLNKYDRLNARAEATGLGKEIIAGRGIDEVIISSILFKVFHSITRAS